MNPKPQGYDLTYISLTNGSLYSSGAGGALIKSTDKGNSWQVLYTGTTKQINAVKFVNNLTGFIAVNDSCIFKTTDSGITWDSICRLNFMANNLCFKNSNTGFVFGNSPYIASTTNGGLSWNYSYTISAPNFGLYEGSVLENGNVVIVGYSYIFEFPNTIYTGRIFLSTNNGSNWINTFNGGGGIRSVAFKNNNTGYVVGRGSYYEYLAKTTDGGYNWVQISLHTNVRFFKIGFTDSLRGYITGSTQDGQIFLARTNDGGIYWNYFANTTNDIRAIEYPDDSTYVGVSSKGNIYRTSNSGSNWNNAKQSALDGELHSIFAISDSSIIAGGMEGYFIKSTDYGRNWIQYYSGVNNFINSIHFINESFGFATTPFYILKTSNGGSNWTAKYNSAKYIECVFLKDAETGYVSGRYGFLMKTTNGGNAWNEFSLDTSLWYTKILFTNQQTGYIVGINWTGIPRPTIYKTSDNGNSWTGYPGPTKAQDMYFINDNTGFCAGYENLIYKTTNGGINWNTYPHTLGSTVLNSITFINDNTGYIVGYGFGSFLKTTDCGITWLPENLGVDNSTYQLYSITSKNGYATYSGNFGTIKSTRFLNTVFVNSQINSHITDFILHQNYPNPFNPATNIKFEVLKTGIVEINIYDILGRVVFNIANERFTPGTYTKIFDGKNLTSGIYFCKMSTDGYSETKKMILLK